MASSQLSIFKKKIAPLADHQHQVLPPLPPTGESTVMQTLPAYLAYLQSSGYADTTMRKYFSDLKRFALFLRTKRVGEITPHDVQQWIGALRSPRGERLDRKTVNRKVSATINYFLWLQGTGAITTDPTATLANARIQSPLPDYLYENEIDVLKAAASEDVRTYLIVLLLLETGMKSNELFTLTKAHVDISDPFAPELWIKHTGEDTRKAANHRKIADRSRRMR
jgi:site-specific recombinase XerD